MKKKIILFFSLFCVVWLSYSQVDGYKKEYTCEEILALKDTLWEYKMDNKVQKDSLGTIICARPTRIINSRDVENLFVVVCDKKYLATINSELKAIIAQSISKHKCNYNIEIIQFKDYTSRTSFFYKKFK